MKVAKLILGILVAGVILSLVIKDIRNDNLNLQQYQISVTLVRSMS